MGEMARRYITVIQDPRGYPPPHADLEPAPPEGPAPPTIEQVVLAAEYDRMVAKVEWLRSDRDSWKELARLANEKRRRSQAEVERLREIIRQARDLIAQAYDEGEHDDSPGNMAFAVLNAALGEVERDG